MILEPGIKILVTHRRLFDGDHSRYFVGIVDGYEDGIARITGHTWSRDDYKGEFRKKPETRTKIISITSGSVIVYQLPATLDMVSVRVVAKTNHLFLEDAMGFSMDITENRIRGASRSTTVDAHRRTA